MKRDHTGRIIYSPSDLCRYAESPYISWMEHSRLVQPGRYVEDPPDPLERVLQRKGNEHERRTLEELAARGLKIVDLRGERDPAATAAAIADGADVIYQAPLARGDFAGIADFVVKSSSDGITSAQHSAARYEIWDSKLAGSVRSYFLLQLCAYADMLEPVLGYRPAQLAIILGNGSPRMTYRTDSYYYYYQELRERFLAFQRSFTGDHPPDPAMYREHGRWSTAAKAMLLESDSVAQVARISQSQIAKLHAHGIYTMSRLAAAAKLPIKGIQPDVLGRLVEQARLQLESRDKPTPAFELIKDTHGGAPLAQLPPSDPADIFFDMEGFPLVQGGLEYLWGWVATQEEKPRFHGLWAHTPDQERQALIAFVQMVHQRWRMHPKMHVYHYAAYETTAIKRLAGRYAVMEKEVDDLLRAKVFVDLYRLVRDGLRIGIESYSIKKVEHLYRGGRSGEVADGGTSILVYQEWQDAVANQDPAAATILESIRSYNEDDCQSTYELVAWIRRILARANIPCLPTQETETATNVGEDPEITELQQQLRTKGAVGELFAHLLEYHYREARPDYWRYFARRDEYTSEQLFDDAECMAGLVRTPHEAQREKRSWLHVYSFDAEQDIKVKPEDSLVVRQDESLRVTVFALDLHQGLITLKSSAPELPVDIDLIPTKPKLSEFASIIRECAEAYRSGHIQPALADFLGRQAPRLNVDPKITRLPSTAAEVDVNSVTQVLRHLDNSCLVVQGPPGSGKTYLAARAIATLVQDGKRVGIMSNSHKAIDNLLVEAAKELQDRGHAGGLVKIAADMETIHPGIDMIESGSKLKDFSKVRLLGGTVYAFAKSGFVDQFDYLFIDEAGQVSIANLVVAVRSTRNLVLLGDQMQLGQPTKGTHPGDSGLSCLTYFLGHHATVPPDLGVFLPITRRLHPSICQLISESVYEGRLQAAEANARRQIVLRGDESYVKKSHGIQFCPVEHSGNRQASDEETSMVVQLITELAHSSVTLASGHKRPLVPEQDILIVAPYNLQVRALERTLGRGYRIGSVDKFQGQEAPVVIVTFGVSSARDAPRGINFLFDKNRLNVAITRAQSLAIVVASPRLTSVFPDSVENMERLNFFCRLVWEGAVPSRQKGTAGTGETANSL